MLLQGTHSQREVDKTVNNHTEFQVGFMSDIYLHVCMVGSYFVELEMSILRQETHGYTREV